MVYTNEQIEMDNFSIHTSLSEEIEDDFTIDNDEDRPSTCSESYL